MNTAPHTVRKTAEPNHKPKTHGGAWAQARALAIQTPSARNRYVDLLRAVSILAVVLGHWIMAAPFYDQGQPRMWHLLAVAPWSQWLTWIFQVMPVFFFVGGFANLTSWRAHRRRGRGFASWLGGRLQRLLSPVLPLLAAWVVLAVLGRAAGVPPGFIQVGSKIALVPIWFLAVYILVVICVPVTHAAWRRYGRTSILAPMAAAALVDLAFFAFGWRFLGVLNYLFVWLAVHQMGYAWHDSGRIAPGRMLLLAIGGLGLLLGLVGWGPYPLSLVGVPTEAVSNTLPPKWPLLALGLVQIGLLLSVQAPVRRWLARPVPWAATILVNGTIMTLFLWHSTAMVLVIGLVFAIRPDLLTATPGLVGWWALRPVWVGVFAAATLPFLMFFSRFERGGQPLSSSVPGLARLYAGCLLTCGGLGYLALKGIGGSPHWLYDAAALALPLAGAVCMGLWRKTPAAS
jgi:hypothetical protein